MTNFWKNGQFWQFCGIEVVLTQNFLSSLGGVCTLVLNLENLLFDVLSALKVNKLPQKKDFQCNEINQHFVVNVFSKYQWNLEVERFKQMNSLFSPILFETLWGRWSFFGTSDFCTDIELCGHSRMIHTASYIVQGFPRA